MKLQKSIIITALAVLASTTPLLAQEDAAPQPRPGGPQGPRGPMPLMIALDSNKDGILDANEINNAPNTLRTLDKNGDGQVTGEELRPNRPQGMGPRGNGPRGEGRGPGGPGNRPGRGFRGGQNQ